MSAESVGFNQTLSGHDRLLNAAAVGAFCTVFPVTRCTNDLTNPNGAPRRARHHCVVIEAIPPGDWNVNGRKVYLKPEQAAPRPKSGHAGTEIRHRASLH
jgi:hypothetical protein